MVLQSTKVKDNEKGLKRR